MNGRTRNSLIAIALSAGALAAAGATASAHQGATIKTPSKISIHGSFNGRVTTPSYQPCQQFRKVVLYKSVTGGPDQKMGTDTTDAHGKWSITPSGFAGISMTKFYARVKKSSQGTAGTIYVCQPAKSATKKPAS
jgi:hypothetical protein